MEKIDVIPGVLAVPTFDEDGVLRGLPFTDDPDPWSSQRQQLSREWH
jgi:hypothetical protein